MFLLTLNFYLKFLQIKLLSSENLGNGSDNDGNLNDLPAFARGVQVTFLQFQIYSFHSANESFARRSLRIFPLFILNMFSFIYAVILLGEAQEGGEGCRKSQRTKDVSFDYNSKVKFWIIFPIFFLTNIKDLTITIITWYFVNQEPPISKISSLSKVQNTRYRKKE